MLVRLDLQGPPVLLLRQGKQLIRLLPLLRLRLVGERGAPVEERFVLVWLNLEGRLVLIPRQGKKPVGLLGLLALLRLRLVGERVALHDIGPRHGIDKFLLLIFVNLSPEGNHSVVFPRHKKGLCNELCRRYYWFFVVLDSPSYQLAWFLCHGNISVLARDRVRGYRFKQSVQVCEGPTHKVRWEAIELLGQGNEEVIGIEITNKEGELTFNK